MTWKILEGDCLAVMRTLPDEVVQCCVTSPPYWGLRDYGHADQLGMESTPGEYVARMVEVFREVRRILRPDGVVWLNLGDSYAGAANSGGAGKQDTAYRAVGLPTKQGEGIKPKDLIGIPWRVALALQADGWWLRSDVIWHKPNPMPESVTDRPTKAHEYVFLLTKSATYFYDADAIMEPSLHAGRIVYATDPDTAKNGAKGDYGATAFGFTQHDTEVKESRNARSVWTITAKPFAGAHFATMPWDLAERCVLAGSAPGSMVLDPFAGTGTVGMVAARHGRSFIGIELNPEYATMARDRILGDAPLLNYNGGTA